MIYGNFSEAIKALTKKLINQGIEVHPNNWQSQDVSQVKAAVMRELLAVQFQVCMPQALKTLQDEIKPNLPWADEHFENERVSGEPINPGETWKTWPWGHSAGTFLQEGQFDHSYAERYWPKYAGNSPDGHLGRRDMLSVRCGVRDEVGDLNDIVDRLEKDPTTRQAVLSVWHPEDQANTGRRVPCSLTYQFLVREGHFHVIYNIRSCDAYRHFRDDLYLTVRLAEWVISRLRERDPSWDNVILGMFTITIGSFHCFINDFPKLRY